VNIGNFSVEVEAAYALWSRNQFCHQCRPTRLPSIAVNSAEDIDAGADLPDGHEVLVSE
jgi:hypothetical protein